jgi:outer membrane autotransporter protein
MLVVDGVFGSTAVTVASGTRLGGTGTVGPLTSAGTIAPGNSIGTLSVAGSMRLDPGSIYEVEVDAAGASDRVVAQASAQLTGNVLVAPAPGQYAERTRYTILTAAGGLGGTQFQGVSVASAGFSAELSYEPTSVILTLLAGEPPQFTGIVINENQRALASVLDALGDSSNVPDSLQAAVDNLRTLSSDQQQAALEQIAPEEHATQNSTAIQTSNQVQRTLAAQIHGQHQTSARGSSPVAAAGPAGRAAIAASPTSLALQSPSSRERRNELWTLVFGVEGSIDPVAGTAGASFRGGGVALGRGWSVTDRLVLGGLAAYSENHVRSMVGGDRTDIDAVQCGLYATWRKGPWYADSLVARVLSDHESRRVITIPGLSGIATGNRDGDATLAFLEAGRAYHCGEVDVVPHSSLQFGHFTEDAFAETGAGALSLSVAGSRIDSLQSSLGVRVEQPDPRGTPQLALRWVRELGEVSRDVDASFVGTAQTFRVSGRSAARDHLQVQASAVRRIGRGPEIELSYLGDTSNGQDSHTGFGRAVWRW